MMIAPRNLDELLFHMPTVARLGNGWAAGFARSILRQSRRRGWRPSEKQRAVMASLVSDLFRNAKDEGGDIDLIED